MLYFLHKMECVFLGCLLSRNKVHHTHCLQICLCEYFWGWGSIDFIRFLNGSVILKKCFQLLRERKKPCHEDKYYYKKTTTKNGDRK